MDCLTKDQVPAAQAADYVALTEIIQPVAPLSPVSPRVKLNAAIAGFLGIFTGVGLAFVSEAWRSRKQYQGRTEELLASQERAGALVEGGSASAQAKAAGQEAAAVSEGDAPSARSLKRAASEG